MLTVPEQTVINKILKALAIEAGYNSGALVSDVGTIIGALESGAGADVTLGGVQTLTNKTLISPVLNGTVTTSGLTMPLFDMGGNKITGLGTPTLGTDGVNKSYADGLYTNGTGLLLSGTTFSIDTSVTVDKTTAQILTNKSISGATNTLSNIPESAITGLAADLASKATDSLVVHLAGAETITGGKTFATPCTFYYGGVGSGNIPSVSLINNYPAAILGGPQNSPSLEFWGSGFGTTGALTQAVKASIALHPIQAANALAEIDLIVQNGGGSYDEPLLGITQMHPQYGALPQSTILLFDPNGSSGYLYHPTSIRVGAASTTFMDINYLGITAGGNVTPYPADNRLLGTAAAHWNCVHSQFYATQMGAVLTAASTITPTCSKHHVTGATSIDTIAIDNIPTGGNVELDIIADSAVITFTNAGNIAINTTLAQGFHKRFVYDTVAALWYPAG